MIPTDTVERIRERVPIERLLERDGVRHHGRAWCCPFHEDRTPSASVKDGRLRCFAVCNRAWDSIDYAMQRYGLDFRGAVEMLAGMAGVQVDGHGNGGHSGQARPVVASIPKPKPEPAPQPTARPELVEALTAYQRALPGSIGEAYLRQRGISLELAQRYGLGYAACGSWISPKREWIFGRVVFPHQTPGGALVNLYGRAIALDPPDAPKALRHDHGRGLKGIFNAAALEHGSGPLYVCEGSFDALALIAAGIPRTIAIFGVNGWRWDWAAGVDHLVLALDTDASGQAAWRKLAVDAIARGLRVSVLERSDYGGHKDCSAAWAAGVLSVETIHA